MLKHGVPEAKKFLPQLELAEVTPWRCQCGCATIKFQIKGKKPKVPPSTHVLAHFQFDSQDDWGRHQAGIMIFADGGILSSLEVYGLRHAPNSLGHAHLVEELLAAGADPAAIDNRGRGIIEQVPKSETWIIAMLEAALAKKRGN